MTENSSYLISVVVPHYNHLTGLERCLASLDQQSLDRTRFEIIVVDNMSVIDRALIERAVGGGAKLLFQPERGAGPARNMGVADAQGEYLAFIDADCVADEYWLEQGLIGLKAFDFIGGKVETSVLDSRSPTGVEAFDQVFAFDFASYIQDKGFTGTGNLFCSRAMFDVVGPFQTGVSEDMEWSHRATAKGFTLGYCPTAIVHHPARREWSELQKKWARLNRETYGLMRRKPWGTLRWLVRSWLLPLSIIPHAAKILLSNRALSPKARLRAIFVLMRIRLWRLVDAHRILLKDGVE